MIVASTISMKNAPATNSAIPLGNGAGSTGGSGDDTGATVVTDEA
jgi:hypothetical protein